MINDSLSISDSLAVQLPEFKDDRGVLSFVEAEKHVPFEVKRVFWIYDVPQGKTRGGHAHWTCHEAVFPVYGSFDIELNDGHTSRLFHLNHPTQGVIIPAGVWCELRNFEAGTVCVVLASQEYTTEGYVHDFGVFKASVDDAADNDDSI